VKFADLPSEKAPAIHIFGQRKQKRMYPIESLCNAVEKDPRKLCIHVHAKDGQMSKLPADAGSKYVLISETSPTLSLKDLMSSSKFTLRERRVLAVILAYSLIYLSESFWMHDRELAKDDVCFLQTPTTTPDISKPFLSICIPDQNNDGGMDDEEWECLHDAQSLLGLGIILMELEFGELIEDLATIDDKINGQKYADTNRLAACRQLGKSRLWELNPYPDFYHAVSSCITGAFLSDLSTNESGEKQDEQSEEDQVYRFQVAIYNNIVKPLEHELFKIDQNLATMIGRADFDYVFGCQVNRTSIVSPSPRQIEPDSNISPDLISSIVAQSSALRIHDISPVLEDENDPNHLFPSEVMSMEEPDE
jgi:hypothetical protein